jgi:tetratricopeptide (TPR) repeat protein
MHICQDADFPAFFSSTAAVLGAAYTLAGRTAEALPLLARALEHATAAERVEPQVFCRLFLGEAQRLAGRLEEAYTLTERTLTLARERQKRGHEAYALHLLGNIAGQRIPLEPEHAASYYQQALTLAGELGMRPLQAHCHRGLGTLYSQTEQAEQARAELSTAIEMYRDMEMTFWLPETEAALAAVEGR